MCGDSHLPPAPESSDLVAIIHPTSIPTSIPPTPSTASSYFPTLSRTQSSSSTLSVASSDSLTTSHPLSIRGRLLLSNRQPGSTKSEFSYDDSIRASLYGPLNVRIHQYGSPLLYDGGNPVVHQFRMDHTLGLSSGVRLDLGVGGDGVVGRTVSIVDCDERVLGEGIIGRI